MATGDQIVENVLVRLVKDDSFDYDLAMGLLNTALVEISGAVTLPNLDTSGESVTVAGNYITALPADYQRGLYMALDGKTPLVVCNAKGDLVEGVGDLMAPGKLCAVAAVGDNLLYGHIPDTATTITMHYYRLPAKVTMKTEPDCFSRNMKPNGERCVEFYMAWKIWEIIEAGEEGNKANTARFETLYRQAMEELSAKATKEGVTNWRTPNVRSSW